MSYDTSKLAKLGHLKELATKIKNDYATKEELNAIKVPEYSVSKQEAAEAGYLSTYYLTKDGQKVGEKINIPKDFLVKSAEVKKVKTENTPYDGAKVGDPYIDFVVNSKEGDDNATHIYLPVNELVDAYTGGNGIEVSPANVISAKIDTGNANGLGVTVAGFKLDLATTTTAGAMSATDKAKLDGVAEGATKVEKSETNGNVKVNGQETVVYTHPTTETVGAAFKKVGKDEQGHVVLGDDVTKEDIVGLGIPAQDTTYNDATQAAAGLMSIADKKKLDGMVVAEDAEVQEMLNEVFAAAKA